MNVPEFVKLLKQGDEVLCRFIKYEMDVWITITSNIYPDLITFNYIVNDIFMSARAHFDDYGEAWSIY